MARFISLVVPGVFLQVSGMDSPRAFEAERMDWNLGLLRRPVKRRPKVYSVDSNWAVRGQRYYWPFVAREDCWYRVSELNNLIVQSGSVVPKLNSQQQISGQSKQLKASGILTRGLSSIARSQAGAWCRLLSR